MIYSSENFITAKNSDTFEFVCGHCGKTFYKTKRDIIKNSGNLPKFCSNECSVKERNKDKTVVVYCEQCGKEKIVELNDYNRSKTKRFFCNSSCAAKYNNHETPKRKKKPEKEKIKKARKTKRTVQDKELGYYVGYDNNTKYLSTKCQTIRQDAKRTLSESSVEKVCFYCKNHEFDEILEVHHLKGILEFDRHTKISEINALKNLVWLCPNHHTMLEKGMINTGDWSNG